MPFRPTQIVAALVLLVLPTMLVAQSSSSSEDERLQRLMDSARVHVPKDTLTVGFHVLNNGGKVTFGNLGIVPSNLAVIPPASDGIANRNYSNGYVAVDQLRGVEKDADGNQIAPDANGRYKVYTTYTGTVTDENGNVTGSKDITILSSDNLAYAPGMTRNWNYQADAQVVNGSVALSTYSTISDGASMEKKGDLAAGVELELNHNFGNLTKKISWGMMAGLAINSFNNKTSGTVQATLHAYTDYYSLHGQNVAAAPYTGPSYADLTDADGNVISTSGYETTVALHSVPDSTTTTDTVGAATVAGRWEVKGAYLMLKLGPSLRAQLNQYVSLTASIGLAGAYAGSTYSVIESFATPDLPDTRISTADLTEETTNKFITGYYADFNIEIAANERTGFYGGITTQKISSFEQALGGRTALVDLGSAYGLRGGITYRF
jgi:hypothetical protein